MSFNGVWRCSDEAKKKAAKAEKLVYLAWIYRQVASVTVLRLWTKQACVTPPLFFSPA